MSLEDDLQEVSGIGPAKAEELREILEQGGYLATDADPDGIPPADLNRVAELLERGSPEVALSRVYAILQDAGE